MNLFNDLNRVYISFEATYKAAEAAVSAAGFVNRVKNALGSGVLDRKAFKKFKEFSDLHEDVLGTTRRLARTRVVVGSINDARSKTRKARWHLILQPVIFHNTETWLARRIINLMGGLGGDIILEDGEGVVQNITATVKLLSGTGPVAGIDVTMSAVAASGYDLPDSFTDLPRVRTTNASGVANFGDLVFYGADGDAFNLQFDYLDPVNNAPDNCICGRYDLVELPE